MPERAHALVVDDHLDMAQVVAEHLGAAGYRVTVAGGGAEALAALAAEPADVVLTDLRMAEVDGFDVLARSLELDADRPVILMTAYGAVETAVEAIKRGAYHYLTKPLRLEEMQLFVDRALEERRRRRDLAAYRRAAGERDALGEIIGRSRPMQELFDRIERVAPSPAPVLLRGESGTGKELVARALHQRGARAAGPFVAVNCSALPFDLLESELFGHLAGAFTGASAARRGLFVEADGGTLFLDEIGDMALALQAKVLRVLEDSEVRPVGSNESKRVDVRIVAATHRDLQVEVAEGRFRGDLFYRLDVVPLELPPLRARPEDVPLLAEHFLARARQRNAHSPVRRFGPEVLAELVRRPWPGNVRELQNAVERLVVIGASEVIELADLEHLRAEPAAPASHPAERARRDLVTLRQLESEYIDWVLDHCGGNKTRAAEILGLDVSTIHRKKRGS